MTVKYCNIQFGQGGGTYDVENAFYACEGLATQGVTPFETIFLTPQTNVASCEVSLAFTDTIPPSSFVLDLGACTYSVVGAPPSLDFNFVDGGSGGTVGGPDGASE